VVQEGDKAFMVGNGAIEMCRTQPHGAAVFSGAGVIRIHCHGLKCQVLQGAPVLHSINVSLRPASSALR
jgi:hypothetical protein